MSGAILGCSVTSQFHGPPVDRSRIVRSRRGAALSERVNVDANRMIRRLLAQSLRQGLGPPEARNRGSVFGHPVSATWKWPYRRAKSTQQGGLFLPITHQRLQRFGLTASCLDVTAAQIHFRS